MTEMAQSRLTLRLACSASRSSPQASAWCFGEQVMCAQQHHAFEQTAFFFVLLELKSCTRFIYLSSSQGIENESLAQSNQLHHHSKLQFWAPL